MVQYTIELVYIYNEQFIERKCTAYSINRTYLPMLVFTFFL